MENEIVIVELEWSEARENVMHVGSPHLFAWIHAVVIPEAGIADGRAVVLAREASSPSWTEFSEKVSRVEVTDLARAIRAVGLQERAARVESVFDTSDVWHAIHGRVSLGEADRAFSLQVQSSGFEGPDADALRAILRAVFRLARYEAYDSVLYGRE